VSQRKKLKLSREASKREVRSLKLMRRVTVTRNLRLKIRKREARRRRRAKARGKTVPLKPVTSVMGTVTVIVTAVTLVMATKRGAPGSPKSCQ
jgi:hypothetical protein